MRYGILNVNNALLGNKIFDKDDPIMNRDDCMYHYWLLREKFRAYGIELVTQDMIDSRNAEFVIFDSLPEQPQLTNCLGSMYLILWESEAIHPWAWWSKSIYKEFKKVFTWCPNLGVDNAVKMYWPQKITEPYKGEKTKFLCIINNITKKCDYYKELYSERKKAIEYFGDRIDVYGHGYRPIPNKYEVMKDYKFAICFENVRDLPGYVTEKIFDCFKAGTVPIYWGNDEGYINAMYIDYGKIKDFKKLDNLLTNMDETTYSSFREGMAINRLYSAENWVNTIVDNILSSKK
jgi:hypothetical protein